MARLQKIMLLVLIVPLALFPGGLILYTLFYEKLKFEMLMWIPLGISFLGLCSFIFHLKTLKFYRVFKRNYSQLYVEPILWVFDLFFGIAYILLSGFLIYSTLGNSKNDPIGILIFVFPMLIIGLWTVIEVVYLHNLIRLHKFYYRQTAIDEISGSADHQNF